MSADFATARLNMVEAQVRTQDVTDVAIHDAMRAVRREDFVPADKAYAAYADADVAYAPGRYLLNPRTIAKLLNELRPQPLERALAIAAPYAAAVLEHIGCSVERLDGEDLRAVAGNDYDIIVCEGAVAEAPREWLAALGPGGRLGVVERDGPVGKGVIYVRAADGVGRRTLFDATPPVLPGFERVRRFAL
ncbi:MAG TPA: protein-L-isoaspartate O-methyltransferase [Caulobacteraceae bacterium]